MPHQIIPAADLQHGDLLRIGSSTNHVLVASTSPDGGERIAVTVYNGPTPNDMPTLTVALGDQVAVAHRGLTPDVTASQS